MTEQPTRRSRKQPPPPCRLVWLDSPRLLALGSRLRVLGYDDRDATPALRDLIDRMPVAIMNLAMSNGSRP